MARKFAVFDIDGTIIRTALFLQIVDELIARGHLDTRLGAHLNEKLEAYQSRAHQTAFQEYNESAVRVLFDNLQYLKEVDYRAAADTVVAQSHRRVYVYTRELIKQLKEGGYFLIALSGSEQYTIERFTQHYGFDLVIGDHYLTRNGHFTGEINSVFHDKGAALKRIVEEHGLDWKQSLGIGDSYGDTKMLDLVARPIAFNPEAELFEHASSKGWEIVIERKNVIYRLEPQGGTYVLAQAN